MANIFETARARHAYEKYIRGLESVEGLIETLSGPGPYTIFIPTDAAFDRLSGEQQAYLFADPGKLAKVVKYHIVPGHGGSRPALPLALRGLHSAHHGAYLNVGDLPAVQSLCMCPAVADCGPMGLAPDGLHRGGALADDLASDLPTPSRIQFPVPLRDHRSTGDHHFPLHVLLAGVRGNGGGARGQLDR